MGIATNLSYATLDQLHLDARNPRLGHARVEEGLSQEDVLDIMRTWTLEELAISYIEEGRFWTHEALLVVDEGGELVVVEGNRRLAALKLLKSAKEDPDNCPKKWKNIVESGEVPDSLFERIPYFLVDDRKDVEAFLGFRHVTGIKEWHPAEKAAYIAKLIDEREFSYVDVMRKIGSKTPSVRQNYISYRLLEQILDSFEEIEAELAEDRFSVMYLSLRSPGVQGFLAIDPKAEPADAATPVPNDALDNLRDYAVWLFGTEDEAPLFTDSRLVDKFGQILGSADAVEYLRRSDRPNWDLALQMAGGEEPEIVAELKKAADSIEIALSRVHHYRESKDVISAVTRVAADATQLMRLFPQIPFGPLTN